MACKKEIESTVVITGNTNVLLAYVANEDNEPITQADVASITVNLFDVTTDGTRINVDLSGAEIAASASADAPDVASTVFDTQTDSRWTKDGRGYNLAYKVIAPLIGKTYDLRLTITTTAGDPLVIARQLVSK